ncbi:RING finger and transmembrane domain-containing protein 2 isoform X4 [Vidua macroura]|uniref:RING finger and transmembrane domain-containing protein 2 isoform X4 n=1 Tax=Vidua macroura TaxID=187451 RepID=UPI0023A7E48E|nr:RING finger and transmembrane domain-containing protein 2 isoform X4 [Vidua macroura]
MLSVLCFRVLRKMQRRHSSNTDTVPPERSRSQTLSSEASVDESGVFESLKAEAASPQQLFSGLAGIPAASIASAPFPAGLVLGSAAGGGEVFIQMPAPRDEAAGRAEGAPFHHRAPAHHFQHGHHRGSSLLHMAGGDRHGHAEEGAEEQAGTPAPALSELKAVVGWLQKGLPFILILLAKVCFQHKLGIAVCIGMASTFAYANSTLREQVALKEKRSVLVVFWILAFLTGNTLYLLYTFSSQQLYNSLIFLKPNLDRLDFFDLMWIVGIADFVLKYLTIALKCLVVALPKIILAVKSKTFPGSKPTWKTEAAGEAVRLQSGWNAGKEELVNWREKQEKEGNPSIRLIPELCGVSRGSHLCWRCPSLPPGCDRDTELGTSFSNS